MTLDRFKKSSYYQIYSMTKPLESLLKDAKKRIFETEVKCGDKVLDFIEKYQHFYFHRIEKCSGDVITFRCSILQSG